MLNFNYVIFTGINNPNLGEARNGYRSICFRDLEGYDGVQLINHPVDYSIYPIRKFSLFYMSRRLAKYIKLPQRLLYPFYFRNSFNDDKPLCFIILDRYYITGKYLSFLKEKYPTAKFVLIHRDLMQFCRNNAAEGLFDNPIFDLEMTYDANEATKYGFSQFDEFESKIDIPKAPNYPISDVFFAGYVKDRLPNLLTAYDIFTNAGLKVDYYLTGVSLKERVHLPGIIYGESPISYFEMLYRTINSRCVLEFVQGGAVGNTSRFLDAVMYNKKLITNNPSVSSSKFYDSRYIQVVKNSSDIDPSFVLDNNEAINYRYIDEFSPIHLIEQIDRELTDGRRSR